MWGSEWGGSIDSEAILDFVEAGHDLIMAVDSTITDDLRGLVSDLGLDIEPRHSSVIDHVAHVVGEGPADHSLTFSSAIVPSKPMIADYLDKVRSGSLPVPHRVLLL